MKDLILVAINAKYIHTNLAVRSLKANLSDYNVDIVEVTINDSIHRIVQHLLATDYKILGFSCYIWNMELVIKISEILKKARPEVQIILGGPEVSFDSEDILKKFSWIDYIISGEGEYALSELLKSVAEKKELGEISGLWFRSNKGTINHSLPEKTPPLDTLVFPYSTEELFNLRNKIVYYETMRGCPYCCSYCLSSAGQGVRTMALERVLKEIDLFIDAGVNQVKLVDRTFNFDIKRAKAIFTHIIEHEGKTNFHFEMTGDLLDDELINLLKKAKPGLIQFEIGVQSTDLNTLKAIGRQTDLTQLEINVQKILHEKNIHIHLDLIAGLPYETYEVFKRSFNRTIALNPDMLQLGFLKCLKGTRIRKEGDRYDYEYMSFTPYEVISNAYISSFELYQLRNIEILLDRYFNSGGFKQTFGYLFKSRIFESPFDFFEKFSNYWTVQGYYDVGKSKDHLYEILLCFLKDRGEILQEFIKFDYLHLGAGHLPVFFEDTTPEKEWIFDFLKDSENVEKYLPEFSGLPAKKIYTQVKIQRFSENLISSFHDQELSVKGKETLVIFSGGRTAFVDEKIY